MLLCDRKQHFFIIHHHNKKVQNKASHLSGAPYVSLCNTVTKDRLFLKVLWISFIYSYPFHLNAENNHADNTEGANTKPLNWQRDLSHFRVLYKQNISAPGTLSHSEELWGILHLPLLLLIKHKPPFLIPYTNSLITVRGQLGFWWEPNKKGWWRSKSETVPVTKVMMSARIRTT